MDYDIIDGGRPRLQLQPGGGAQSKADVGENQNSSLSNVYTGICAAIGIVLLALGYILLAGPFQFLAVWLGLALVLGPFAPQSVTGGDCRVGVGEPVLPEDPPDDKVEQIGGGGGRSHHYNSSREKHNQRQPVEIVNGLTGGIPSEHENGKSSSKSSSTQRERGETLELEGKEWTSEDLDLLKKLIVKHPRGTLKRWEVIAEALGGKHSVDSVVKMSKALGQKKVGGRDQDAYSRFLSQRKVADVAIESPLSRREDQVDGEDVGSDEPASVAAKWTEVEDKALVTALKTFPKDTPMRWDKVALAVPGRTKAQCFRRFSDLRKNFRSTMQSTL